MCTVNDEFDLVIDYQLENIYAKNQIFFKIFFFLKFEFKSEKLPWY